MDLPLLESVNVILLVVCLLLAKQRFPKNDQGKFKIWVGATSIAFFIHKYVPATFMFILLLKRLDSAVSL